MTTKTPKLTDEQQRFVEEFGNLYGSYGARHLNGLVIGLLLSAAEPMSLGDIATALERSKGLLSEALRRLHSFGYVKKVSGPEKRKDYYLADTETFVNVFNFNMATVRQNSTIAESFLTRLAHDRAAEHARFKENLEVMRSFYDKMTECFQGFARDWRQTRESLQLKRG